MALDVYGVGNALVDIEVHVSDEFLEEIDYAKGMMTLVDAETQKAILERLNGYSASRCAGGSAANTVFGVAGFGGKAAYSACIGRDEPGHVFQTDLTQLNVRNLASVIDGASGTCLVLITDDAQRTMLTSLGVSAKLGPDDIDEEAIREAAYVYIEGYLFASEPTRSAALRAIDIASKHDTKVAFTVSDPFLIQYHRDEFWQLIEGPVDLLFCNLEESRALTGLFDAVDCAREIHAHAENVALTMGPDGSVLMHNGDVIPIEGVSVDAVDTTGAGDMYAAGILYGITNGLTWEQSGRLASHAAARVVSQLGARLKQPFTAEEIAQIIG